MHKNTFYKPIANVFWMYNLSNLLLISWACFYFNEGFFLHKSFFKHKFV